MRRGAVLSLIVLASACSSPSPRPRPRPAPPPTPTARPPIVLAPTIVEPEQAPEPAPREDLRSESLHLAFTGDVMFGRLTKDGIKPIPAEREDVFGKVAPLLDSDFTMVNLETPILRDPPDRSPDGKSMRFVTTPARVATLKSANVDAVTLANNHAYDVGLDGVTQTPEILDELGIRHIGAHRAEPPIHRVETIEVQGWRIGFIAATTMRNLPRQEDEPELPFSEWNDVRKDLLPVVEAARPDHDLVIVVVHWGDEYLDEPDQWQKRAAHAWIDAGADAVIGHHAHVLQGIERYGNGVIAYSLGNFLFDNLSTNRRLHGILHLTFRRDGSCLDELVYHPTASGRPYFRPAPARKKDFTEIADRLQTLSAAEPLRTTWTIEGDTLVAEGACR